MSKSIVIEQEDREAIADPVTDLLRAGAQQLIQRAVEAELCELLSLPRPTISLDSDLRNYNAGGSRYVQRNEGGIRNREGSP